MFDGKNEPAQTDSGSQTLQLKAKIHRKLLQVMNLTEARRFSVHELHAQCAERVDALLREEKIPLSGPEKQQLIREVMDEVFGYGPLNDFLRDPTVSDILVNGPHKVYVERRGRLEATDATFLDDQHLMRVIRRIADHVGRRIDESTPMLDARLPDGSRVNAIVPPLALDGPAVSIRRFGTNPLDMTRLIAMDALRPEMASFVEACVQCKLNILISGGTGTGKTTFLNALSRWVPSGERLLTIEDAAELQLQREHVVRLETRPPNIEGKGEITQRDLLKNSLRMRPDRIIIGEVRGSETLDMLQAMNTGHEGSMTTVHANNPRDALRRLENMVSMAGLNYPVHAIREQISSALDVMIHLGRLAGGSRKVVQVVEITGMEGETICLHDLFHFVQKGVDVNGDAYGDFEVCGVRPHLLAKLKAHGIEMPPDMFQRRILTKPRLEPEPASGADDNVEEPEAQPKKRFWL
ncbi:CpaF family protein [Anaerobaca lacustris]|uniref:CpaF family protein n=1 Tax=Anaerobaca lacustris TaxID=3044600 RepID=A0AAW6U6F4_9BACT|nr:CpaF family protein [Sedimentisphaerales bacterium M17dextr]